MSQRYPTSVQVPAQFEKDSRHGCLLHLFHWLVLACFDGSPGALIKKVHGETGESGWQVDEVIYALCSHWDADCAEGYIPKTNTRPTY